ncbi:MAG TPA: group 1 truncated hemoglobin, partial [Tepidisphaeraceae bacterium]
SARPAPFFLVFALIGCGGTPTNTSVKNEPQRPPGATTLYERLGGGATIYAIADNLIEKTMLDPRVNLERTGHAHVWTATPDHIAELKMYWAQFLGVLADGPQLYEGRNMLDLHRGMQISQPEWNAFMEDLKAVLARSRIRAEDQRDLVTRVAGTHDVIVDK